MKKISFIVVCFLAVIFSALAQTPRVYCTFWDGTSEHLAHLNFATSSVDEIGEIQGSTIFPLAQANGYDSYRNRYYTISNQGLVAIDASSGIVLDTASQFADSFKHLSYNPITDLLFATRYNGFEEEYYQISPETFQVVNQGILNIGTPFFVVGFYGSDAFSNEVIFQTSEPINGIKTVNMSTGQVTNSFTKPSYMANALLAAHDPVTDFYYATGLRNTRLYLLQINKSTRQIDTVGQIPGATAIALVGSAIDVVNRKFIFVSNLGITVVSLDNPSNTSVIPYPSGVSNVKGFQTNYFSQPVTRVQGNVVRAQFRNVEAWLKDGNEIPNSSFPEYTPTASGLYSYKVRRSDGSVVISSPVLFSVTTTLASKTESEIKVYYDRENDKLHVGSSESGLAECRLFNTAGNQIQVEFTNQKEILLSSMKPAVYLVKIYKNGQVYTRRFVKP